VFASACPAFACANVRRRTSPEPERVQYRVTSDGMPIGQRVRPMTNLRSQQSYTEAEIFFAEGRRPPLAALLIGAVAIVNIASALATLIGQV